MQTTKARLVGCFALLAALGLAGCGDSTETVPGETATIDDAPAALADAFCTSYEACFGSLTSILLGGNDCRESLTATFTDETVPRWKLYIAAGTLAFHGDQLAHCTEAIAALGCGITEGHVPEHCQEALDGNVALGGACDGGEECAGDAFCAYPADACPGTCTALLGEASACDDTEQCERGLRCAVDPADSTAKCTKPVASGGACASDENCTGGEVCRGADGATNTLGTCQSWSAVFSANEGDTCDPGGGSLCKEGLACVLDSYDPQTGPGFSCVKPYASGTTCMVGYPNPCPAEEYCNADLSGGMLEGTCVAAPKEGEACLDTSAGGATPACAQGLLCDEDNICKGRARTGEACVGDGLCYSNTCSNGLCVDPSACQAP